MSEGRLRWSVWGRPSGWTCGQWAVGRTNWADQAAATKALTTKWWLWLEGDGGHVRGASWVREVAGHHMALWALWGMAFPLGAMGPLQGFKQRRDTT